MPKRDKPAGTNETTDICQDLLELLQRAFSDGLIEMPWDEEENYLDQVYPALRASLFAIRGMKVCYEDTRQECLLWDSEDSWDALPIDDVSRSYRVLFLAPSHPQFQFAVESEEEDETGRLVSIEGSGVVGHVVGISTIAPVAIIRLDRFERYSQDSYTIPDVFNCWFDLDGNRSDPEENYQEFAGVDEEGVRLLQEFRDEIVKTVVSHGIRVLSKDEGDKSVPWLQPGEEAWLGTYLAGGPVTVRDAFFFRMP